MREQNIAAGAGRLSRERRVPADFHELPARVNSKSEIVTAGKVIREHLSEDAIPDIERKRAMTVNEAFRIAHAWRDAHMRPLLRVRQELGGQMRSIERGAISAARLKRMASIRSKLQRPFTLYQIQDIAGCRAIVRSMSEVRRLAAFYKGGKSRHLWHDEDDYIAAPKRDGYRSHHLIMKFRGEGDDAKYNRQTVEIQIRTRAQHAWATAVEAVGLIRNENIKGGSGDPEWRRFFELMSSEIACEEGCAPCPTATGSQEKIHEELRELSRKIKAVSTLETYNRAIKHAERRAQTYAQYYLLQFDYDTREVIVTPYSKYELGAKDYIEAEKATPQRNSVLVEVSKVADLQKAFPNYFLDVSDFTARLKRVLLPGYGSSEKYDLSWLRRYR